MTNSNNDGSGLADKIKTAAKRVINNSTTGVLKDMASGAKSVGNAVNNGAKSVDSAADSAGTAVKGGAVSAVKKLKSLF